MDILMTSKSLKKGCITEFFFGVAFLYVNLHSMIVWLFYMALMSPVFCISLSVIPSNFIYNPSILG